MKNGDIIDLTGVPEEFSKQVEDCQGELLNKRADYVDQIEAVFEKTNIANPRGEIAREWMKDNKDLAPMLFARLDGKSYTEAIWKKIKPQGDQHGIHENTKSI